MPILKARSPPGFQSATDGYTRTMESSPQFAMKGPTHEWNP
jgi:hypothetical protein